MGRFRNPFRRRAEALDCAAVGELLQRWLDADLDHDLSTRLDAHLDDCLRCGLEAETYQRIKVSLAQRRVAVPDDTLERLRSFGEQIARGQSYP